MLFLVAMVFIVLFLWLCEKWKGSFNVGLVITLTTIIIAITCFVVGTIQIRERVLLDKNRAMRADERATYISVLEVKEWKAINGYLEFREKVRKFNWEVERAKKYSSSFFAPFTETILFEPSYVGLEPIPIREAGT